MRAYAPSDATRVRNLQVRYAQAYPGAAVISREVYSYPAFQGGRNVRGAFDPQGDLVGYAPMFPQPVPEGQIAAPHVIWAEIKADPAIEEPVVLKEALWDWVLRRAREIREALPPHPMELRFRTSVPGRPAWTTCAPRALCTTGASSEWRAISLRRSSTFRCPRG